MTVHSNKSARKSNVVTIFVVELGEKKNARRHDDGRCAVGGIKVTFYLY
jgi:hypothetical protein